MIKLTKEQEEAIEILNSLKTIKVLYGNTFAMHLEQLEQIQNNIEIVLNLIQEQQEENEKKDRQIEIMADYLKRTRKEQQIKDEVCCCCTTEFEDEDCKDCIKQYFENQAKM